MKWHILKQLIRSRYDRVVVVEDGEPRYVVLPLEEYQKLLGGVDGAFAAPEKAEDVENANHELQEIQENGDAGGAEVRGGVFTPGNVRVEDLPF